MAFLFLYQSHTEAQGETAWKWGYEAACIARSLAEGEGFGNPWMRAERPWNLASGATAWLPPAYPALLALILKVCGGVGAASAVALFVVQSALSAGTCALLVGLGRALGEPRAGRLAGWILCFDPVSVWNAAHTVWDTTLVAFALTWFLLALFRRGPEPTPLQAARLGALFGLLMLVNPAPSTIALAVFGWWVARRARPWSALVRVGAFALAAFLVVLPWLVRNQRALGAFTLRTNLGVEAMVGNNDGANGYFQSDLHPSYSAERFLRYRALGEVEYSAQALATAREWALGAPARFLGLCLRRAQIFWFGDLPTSDPRRELGLAPRDDPKSWIKWANHLATGVLCLAGTIVLVRRRRAGVVLLAILLLFPAPYYLTHFMERYRFPIEPLIVLLASVFLLSVYDRVAARRRRDILGA